MKSIFVLATFMASALMPAVALAYTSGHCGYMYWPVKTGTDPDAGLVDLAHIIPTTAAEMDSWQAPGSLGQNTRYAPHETTVYQVKGTLTQIYFSKDGDEHMLIDDGSGGTPVTAEIPSPDCVGAGSPFLAGINAARQAFDSQFSGSVGQQITENVPVTITGVGFFDDPHSPDCAANGIELHPVLSMTVGSSQ